MSNTHTFWAQVQSKGEVYPVNLDHSIYYTEEVIQKEKDGAVGQDIRFIHNQDVDAEDAVIGEVLAQKTFKDNQFVLMQTDEELWDNFVESLEQENLIIPIGYTELIEEIDAGNLAVSAGLQNAYTAPTPDHDYTVMQYDWEEVSIVPTPGSPGAWAWQCDDQCRLIFGETMSEKEPELEPDQGGDGDDDGGDSVQNPASPPKVMQFGDEEYHLVPEEQFQQGDCSCNTQELKSKVEQLEKENEQYEQLVQKFKQERREKLTQRAVNLNESLPEDAAWEEDELKQEAEEADLSVLQERVNTLERLQPQTVSQSVSEDEEDLSGSGSSNDNEGQEMDQRIDQASKELFGRPLDEVLESQDEEYKE